MSEVKKGEKSLYKKILDILYYIVVGIIIIVSLSYTILSFSTKNGITNVCGYILSSVQSDSMSPTFEKGDFIVTKQVDVDSLKKDDIISFYYIDKNTYQRIIVTHRIIDFRDDGQIITQGDLLRKNNSHDSKEIVSKNDVISKYTGVRIKGLGKVTDFVKTKVGFFVCILVPVFIFLFWQIYVFVKALIDAKQFNKQKAINDEARALAEQMLKQMQEENAQDNSQENSKE